MWQAIGAIGGSLLSGLFGSSGAKKQNAAQIQSAREQMDFQRAENEKAMAFSERMSNTAHQREIKDLEAAGINPILSAKLGGASSPSGVSSGGAQANIVNEMAPMANAAQSLADKAYNFKVQQAQVNNMRLQNDLIKEQINAAKISNARQGLLTPAYEAGGDIVNKVVGGAQRLVNAPDLIGEVLDMAGVNNTGINLDDNSTAQRLPPPPKGYLYDSQAGAYVRGEKGFWQSFKDAQRLAREGHASRAKEALDEAWRQKYELTEEKLKAYGIRNLDAIRRRAGK